MTNFGKELIQSAREALAMTTPHLKPCPFCGGEASLMYDGPVVVCRDCPACMGEYADHAYPSAFETIDESITAWNRRDQ